MKKLIILPGNSKRNQAWGESAKVCFGNWFEEVYLQYYDHWPTDSNEMDFESELSKLNQEVEASEIPIVIFAKSIGTLLTLLSVQRGDLNPEKCVFFGMPLNLADGELFKTTNDWNALSNFAAPTLAFHNEHDPTADCHFAESKLEELDVTTITLKKIAGDTHDYTDFDAYQGEIKDFLQI